MFGMLSNPVKGNDSSAEEVKETAPVEDNIDTGETTEVETESEAVENAEADANASDTVENDDSEETSVDTETETVKKPKKGFERRIERFNQKLSQKDQEIEYWKKAAMGGNHREVQPEQTVQVTEKPQFADFNDIETYTEALTDWKVQKVLESVSQTQQVKSVVDSYTTRLNEFRKETPDFQDVMDEFVEEYGDRPVPEIVQVAMESEVGPQIAYYLAKNTDEVDRIANLPPHRRLLELGKLEDRLSQSKVKKTEQVTKKVSNAPEPIKSVKGTGKIDSNDIYADLPYEQWVKVRTKKK